MLRIFWIKVNDVQAGHEFAGWGHLSIDMASVEALRWENGS
jgi:hypothetical protein